MNTKTYKVKGLDGKEREIQLKFNSDAKGDIINYNDLRTFYEKSKAADGLCDEIKFADLKVTEEGEIIHAFACLNFKDSAGFSADFVGEINCTDFNDCAKKYPLAFAVGRALGAALLVYYGFPKGIRTTMNALSRDKYKVAAKSGVPKVEADADTKEATDAKPETDDIVTNTLSDDETIPFDENTESDKAPVKTMEEIEDEAMAKAEAEAIAKAEMMAEAKAAEEAPKADIEVKTEVTEEVAKDAAKTVAEEPTAEPEPTVVEEKVEEKNKNEPAKEVPVESETVTETAVDTMGNTPIGFGKYANLTIDELFAKKAENDEFAVKFIKFIKAGTIVANNAQSQEVIDCIKKRS